ncbi:sporulation histidine kinase inhibitor Sda [Niallia sp. Krafla_26]|uniref:sporulation histidine kinase inhibitor Sda n=1 Tax=Niallia sp. Krafla_26 TaxID=3064703 RepID=UPI003D16C48F
MKFQNLSDELLINSYSKAIELKLDDSFTRLLFNEIERRNIQHMLIKNDVQDKKYIEQF